MRDPEAGTPLSPLRQRGDNEPPDLGVRLPGPRFQRMAASGFLGDIGFGWDAEVHFAQWILGCPGLCRRIRRVLARIDDLDTLKRRDTRGCRSA